MGGTEPPLPIQLATPSFIVMYHFFVFVEEAPPDYNSLFGITESSSSTSTRPSARSPVPREEAIPMTRISSRQPQSQMHPSRGRLESSRHSGHVTQDRSCLAYAKRNPEKSGESMPWLSSKAAMWRLFGPSGVLFTVESV